MKNKQLLKEFISFLRHEDVYTEYVNELKQGEIYRLNCATIQEENELEWLINTIKKCPENLILDAFSWPHTIGENGVDWMEINDNWVKKLNRNDFTSLLGD